LAATTIGPELRVMLAPRLDGVWVASPTLAVLA